MNDATSSWQPVLPSHELRACDNIVAAISEGEELALWRSADGAVQAWEDRCPHRGTRLSLGQVVDGRLSCAYHGWEFEAGSGRCAAVPAHPAMTAPRSVCVKTFDAAEGQGMIWIRTRGGAAAPSPAETAAAAENAASRCRSMGIRASSAEVEAALHAQGFSNPAPGVWQGSLGGLDAKVFVTNALARLTFVHAWLDAAPTAPTAQALQPAFAALRLLRGSIEQSA